MNTSSIGASSLESADESPPGDCRSLYFQSEERSLFGWLHGASATAEVGLVICNPFGYEAICGHRSVRAFAQRAASAGLAVLRFDYAGTGNSQNFDAATDQIGVWTRDVVAAADALRRHTGVQRICLLGFRLGALIATLAAKDCGAAALVAVAPITNGKRYLRELRTVALSAGGVAPVDDTSAMEVSGFPLSAASMGALARVDLSTVPLPTVTKALVIDRKELPGARAWSDGLSQSNVNVEYAALPGFIRMMMTAPHLSLVPQAMVAAVGEWLTCQGGTRVPQRTDAIPEPQAAQDAAMKLPGLSNTAPPLTESALELSRELELFGVVTEPPHGEVPRRGVILLNAGATHHIGPNRMYVDLARRWAASGCVVVRMDIGGLGDSAPRVDRPEFEVYPSTALRDIRVAVDFLQQRFGVVDITLGGLCSGAYHALRAAAAGLPVRRILMVNPLNFRRRDGMTLDELTWLNYVHAPRSYAKQVLPAKFWQSLFSGRINATRLIRLHLEHGLVVLDALLREVARPLGLPLPRDLGNELETIAGRGIDMTFVFSEGETGIDILRHQAGAVLRRLGTRCRMHTIPGADHIFSQSPARRTLQDTLTGELLSRSEAAPAAGDAHVSDIQAEQVG